MPFWYCYKCEKQFYARGFKITWKIRCPFCNGNKRIEKIGRLNSKALITKENQEIKRIVVNYALERTRRKKT